MHVQEILPFHLFHYEGESYVINIEKMQAKTVDNQTAEALKGIASSPDMMLSPDLKEKLLSLELLMNDSLRRNSVIAYQQVPVTSMSLLVTQACNLRCVYCYEDKTNAIMDEVTAFQSVDWLIKHSGDMKCITISFFGGEPLLNFPLIKTVVEYAQERATEVGKKVWYSITTNGTLLNDEIICFLKDHNFSVQISFDGLKELQDAQRPYATGRGSYNSVVPKIKELLKVLPQTSAHAVIMGSTSPEAVKLSLQELGFNKVSAVMNSQSLFTTEQKDANPVRDTSSMFLSLNEEANAWYRLIRNRDYSELKMLTDRSGLYFVLQCLLHNTIRKYFCGAGRSFTAVTPSGDVYLCHRFVGMEEYILGNICNQELDNDIYHKNTVDINETCKNCFARYYCGGGCMHDNASSAGSIFTPEDKMCLVKRRELELGSAIVSRLTSEDLAFLIKEKIFSPKPCPFDF